MNQFILFLVLFKSELNTQSTEQSDKNGFQLYEKKDQFNIGKTLLRLN